MKIDSDPPFGRGGFDPDWDAGLVARCLGGDARSWEALVRRYERLVYAVARSYRLSDDDAGDVFQDVFAALVRGLPRLRDARSLCRWLSSTTDRIARATALRTRREMKRVDGGEHLTERLVAEVQPPGADLEVIEEQAIIRLALRTLPERCRRLLLALYYEDPPPSYTALSNRLATPIGSIGPTRARCLEALRKAVVPHLSGARVSGPPEPPPLRSEGAGPRRGRPRFRRAPCPIATGKASGR